MLIFSELIKLRFGNSDELAASKASVAQILPIFAPPLLGHWIERRGKRPHLGIYQILLSRTNSLSGNQVILAAATFLLSMVLIGFTQVSPVKSMVMFSISLALGVIPSISSIPLLLPPGIVGTGFGLYKTTISIGSVLQDIIAGALQDDKRGPLHSYDLTMGFLLLVSGCSLIISLGIFFVDKVSWGGFLALGTVERQVKYPGNRPSLVLSSAEPSDDGALYHPLLGDLKHQIPAWYNSLPPITLGLALIGSWYMFIIYFL